MKKNIKNGTDFEIKDAKMDFYEGLTAWQIVQAIKVKSKDKGNKEITISLDTPVPTAPGKYNLKFTNYYGDSAEMNLELVAPKK